ncbi:phycobilisome rod-core linker polypeptide [Oscillatoriales cyanobacterium LEGE 11467]|uniref:Phycobilisome rod-core linker polypeptide n=1 Tax=Zarconia navalis LEGE 11467 TaxID=1828826 RepID=A0A928Z9C9_9CYAN|nr:phycobilisome rod-core linker polypeptide [Zarconia navalis]MBE9040646.1 phycobilisome rod-core linker polypeptide [Zarconia navalis LEGE 11467]
MTLPLLSYPTKSQNQRVAGYEIPGDESPRIFTSNNLQLGIEVDRLIQAAYRQIYNEQQLLSCNRQKTLESQLRSGEITVREFIRGLVLSEPFRTRNYECNNNYRFVQMCVQRVLGRDVYDEREKLARSTVLATQGLQGFINALLDSDEYLENFGENTVPYQRRRILPQRIVGDLPFARMPRYGADYRTQLEALGYNFQGGGLQNPQWDNLPPRQARLAGAAIAIFGATFVSGLLIAAALAAFGFISL